MKPIMKKALTFLTALCMIVCLLTEAAIPALAADTGEENAETVSDYALAPDIRSGNILQAFNWRMTDLVKYAPEIAAAGYTAVQISPIQATRRSADAGSYATDWHSFYEPIDMTVGNALGSKEDLKAAIEALHAAGVKVIADVVTNHVRNCVIKADTNDIASTLRSSARQNLLVHQMTASDNSRQAQVQGDLDGRYPDMDTRKKSYQDYVISNLLLPLAEAGIDGYRFDSAKNIETPDDGAYASNYWPSVTSAIHNKNEDAFIYGEVLDSAGKFRISSYTAFMSVTDWAYGGRIRAAMASQNASALVDYGWTGSEKADNVLWVESYRDFCSGESTNLTKKQQILGWAIVGCRADAPALFFVRPKHEQIDREGVIKYDELMGAPGSADTWKDPTVTAVNRFKNAFAGQEETASASDALLFVQRGSTGMVIVNLTGASASISRDCTMDDGTYTDQVTGNTFTVSGGTISGEVGSSGVAVVYNVTAENSAPSIDVRLDGVLLTPEVLSRYTGETAEVAVELGGAVGGSVKVSNLDAVEIANGETVITLNSSVPYGTGVEITVTASNGVRRISRSYTIKKKDPQETKTVYFDNTAMRWPVSDTQEEIGIFVYCKTGISPGTQLGGYGEYRMNAVEGEENLYVLEVPAGTNYVKFHEASIGESYTSQSQADEFGRWHKFHTFIECGGYCGRTMPETVVNYGTSNSAANRENGGYELTGAMILRDLRFEDYGEYPVAELTAADVTIPEPPITRPMFRNHRMRLSAQIGVEFELVLPKGYDLSPDAEVRFTLSDGRTQTVPVTKSDWFTCHINAMELADTITAEFYNGEAKPACTEKGYSAMTYFGELRANDEYAGDEELMALIDSLQDLGACLQLSDWTDLDDSGNEQAKDAHEKIDLKLGDGEDDDGHTEALLAEAADLMEKTADLEIGENDWIEEVRLSLVLNAETTLHVFVKTAKGADVSDETPGYQRTIRLGGVSYHWIRSGGIKASQLLAPIDFDITGSGGNVLIQAGPMQYVKMMLAQEAAEGENGNNRAAVAAFARYAKCADAYKGAGN